MHDFVEDTRKRLFPNCVLQVYPSFAVYIFFPCEFYGQMATKARQICRI